MPDEVVACCEQKYGPLHEVLGDILYKISPDGIFEYVNGAVRNIGYEPGELIGRHFSTIVHPEYIESVCREFVLPRYRGKQTGDDHAPKLFDERRSGSRMTKNLQVKLIPKGWHAVKAESDCVMGHAVAAGEVNASGLYEQGSPNAQARFTGTVGVIRDVTEKLRAEEELRKAERLDSLRVLAGGIAHDFNNLLTGVYGHLQLALQTASANPLTSGYIGKAMRSFELAKSLTDQLLTIAKGCTPFRSVVNIEDVVRRAASLSLSGANVRCTWCLDNDLETLEADGNQLFQLFSNILINARQAMPGGGVIEIWAHNRRIEGGEGESLPPGSYVEVGIRDQGPGIPESVLPRIFDPFFTTKPDGSGLGLAVSYSIVKNHGGRIDAMSEAGRGTLFTICLPSAPGRSLPPPSGDEMEPLQGRGRVLIMDDDPTVCSLVGIILTRAGYQVIETGNGEAAIKAFRKALGEGAPFDAVILDMTVAGGLGGAGTIAQLLTIDPGVAAIATSGYPQSDYQAAGFVGMVAKPFLANELLAKTAAAVARKQQMK